MKDLPQQKKIMENGGLKSLATYYEESLARHRNIEAPIKELLANPYAKKFINSFFEKERKNKKIKACLDLLTPFRSIHTVSSYLLGQSIRDQLQFDTRSWQHLPGEKSSEKSFDLFWSWICLFHDIGYYYEDHSKDYELKSIEDLCAVLNIQDSLLAVSPHKELIKNYFAMRLQDKTVDHGIVGALLLFDALMDLSKTNEIYSSIKNFDSFFVKLCDTIALHNMWRADDDTIPKYNKFGLYELIPENGNFKIYYKDDVLLYLLGLVDTLDPIKAFCRDRRYKKAISTSDVLDNVYLKLINYSGQKKVCIVFQNDVFDEYAMGIINPQTGLPSWLGTFCIYDSTKFELTVIIDLKGSSMPQEKSA